MKTFSILVAEDERDVLDVILRILELSGFEAVGVPNGLEAVNKAKEIIPDLILLDVRMPAMTGYEACEMLKTDEATRHIPVVFLSAKGQEAEIEYGLKLGAAEYLVKPFELTELVKVLKRVLEEHQDK
ncbi:MAG: response regulator [Anaerolineae bacterium]|nr:response regulator [Anaerolineae bacterium]